MARKDVTPVKQEALLAVIQKLGMATVARKGWIKCYKADAEGKPTGKPSIGIPTTKMVTRVEFVNFEHDLGVKHPKPPAGSVTQMLNFEQDEKQIIRDLYRVCKEGVLSAKPSKSEEKAVQAEAEHAAPAENGQPAAATDAQ
jgi:hypothetical protein